MDQQTSSDTSFSPSGHGEEKAFHTPAVQSRTEDRQTQTAADAAASAGVVRRITVRPQWRLPPPDELPSAPAPGQEPGGASPQASGTPDAPPAGQSGTSAEAGPQPARRTKKPRGFLFRRRRHAHRDDPASPADGAGAGSLPGPAGQPEAEAARADTEPGQHGQPGQTDQSGQQGQGPAEPQGSAASAQSGDTAGRAALSRSLSGLSQSRFLRGRTWSFLLSANILAAIVLGIILVWVSIERMDINYFINLEQVRLREKQSLHGKLLVEKERLLSPYELRIKAEKLGMKAPKPGQIRRIDLGSRTPAKPSVRKTP